MPNASKRSRTHKKPRPGPSSGNTVKTGKGKDIEDASVNTGEPRMGFTNLPVDVFLEIAAYCHPLDLLHLSRISPKLRAIVFAKRNKNVWACMRANLDPPMPSCSDDLSEPKYVSMVFDRFCMACGTMPSIISYAAHIRLCEHCWETNVKSGSTIICELELKARRDRSLKRIIFDLLPDARLDSWMASGCGPLAPGEGHHTWHYWQNFYQPEVTAIAKEYCALVESSRADSKILEEFVEDRAARTRERLKFEKAVDRWERRKAKKEAEEAAAMKRAPPS
ncbi:hypothetical protein LXA43DRAFT_245655 [Ganoderma leucocontextum]|nr:hypothetical protein LXA43DRAFT_245655 [Ganoderma leucocontextum]